VAVTTKQSIKLDKSRSITIRTEGNQTPKSKKKKEGVGWIPLAGIGQTKKEKVF